MVARTQHDLTPQPAFQPKTHLVEVGTPNNDRFREKLAELKIGLFLHISSPKRGIGEDHMASPSKPHILVVDDEPAIRSSVEMILKVSGYDVSLAADGFDALLQLRRLNPAIVISNLNMPRMSGFAAFALRL